jgi:nitroimidazol reductase NimA-like FMN-containing flavoprotein (pyridoxamine 5'-phosphate oxidase superfamily)
MEEVKSVIRDLLQSHNSLTLASTGGEYSPWILSVYFATEGDDIYFFLETAGKTYQNIQKEKKVAIAISDNDASKDFLQAYGEVEILSQSESDKVRQLILSKMPWFMTYTPVVPIRLKIKKYFVSSLSRNWFPAKIINV